MTKTWLACPCCGDALNLTIDELSGRQVIFTLDRGRLHALDPGGLDKRQRALLKDLGSDEVLRIQCNGSSGCGACFTVDWVGVCTDILDPKGEEVYTADRHYGPVPVAGTDSPIVTVLARQPDECDDPDCPGWFANEEYGHVQLDDEQDGPPFERIERCDQCQKYASDEDAALAHFHVVVTQYFGADACPSHLTLARKPR